MPFIRRFLVLALALVATAGPACGAPALRDVRSYLYLVFSQTNSPGIYDAIRAAPHDLVILGVHADDPPLDRNLADPGGSKLILGYGNLTLASTWHTPNLFGPGGVPPAWFGNQDPDWPGNYSVQFWNSAWLEELKARIDKLIADGYDGVLLDSASGDFAWASGNAHGNPVFPTASRDLGILLMNLKSHVQAKGLAKPFYIVPNDPIGVAQNYPIALSALDGIFVENLYFISTGVGGLNTSIERPPGIIGWVENNAGRIYGTLGIPIFGNDYPQPATDRALALRSFLMHNELGWIPSVVNAEAMVNTIARGPHMFTATPGSPSVRGTRTVVNYLSGGKADPAFLVGGDQGDYFVGGEGVNSITGGAGDDVVYPHPQKAALQQILKLTLQSTVVGNRPTPKLSVLLNGNVVVPRTTIDATQPNTQDVIFEAPRGVPISSVVLNVTDAEYIDAQNYSNLQIKRLSYKGASVDLASAVISSGGKGDGWAYSDTGTVTFPASAFVGAPAYPVSNATNVDGGAGLNTAVYFGRYSNYSIARGVDGALMVTSRSTAEGPDTLRNIQRLKFSDDCMFDWLERAYPQYLAPPGGVSSTAAGLPYYYRYYAGTGNYVATSSVDGRLWLLGEATAGVLRDVGTAADFEAAAGCSP